MSEICLQNVSLSYPVIGVTSQSLRRKLYEISTGGRLGTEGKVPVVDALRDISVTLKPGDRLGLIGHNGAGKSTLLRVLAGIYEADVGHVKIDGEVSALLDIGMGLENDATGYENIRLRQLIAGNSKDKSVVADIEKFTDLGDFLGMPIKTYSAGMRIRLAFALSTMKATDILLLDEVIGVGDAQFMEQAKLRMNKMIEDSSVMVLSSHDTQVVRRFCNQAMWLEHGKIKAHGAVDDVIQQYDESSTTFD